MLSHELLNKSATLEASVTKGSVSGVKQDTIGQDLVQTDAAASHGNSGGPAITDEATVIGVLTFISLSPQGGSVVQGFNFLIPARDVRKFVEGTDVVPGRDSGFNRAWVAGLTRALQREVLAGRGQAGRGQHAPAQSPRRQEGARRGRVQA